MSHGLVAVLVVLAIIVVAVISRRCVEVLFFGSLLTYVILYRGSFLGEWTAALQQCMADNTWIFLVCGLFGSVIELLEASGGSLGFAKLAEKFCTNRRRTMLSSFALGILIFIDDYLNVMTVGVCMKRLYDKHKIPREMLAYVLDSTGAPVCVLLPFSTWAVFFAGLFAKDPVVKSLGMGSMAAYARTIPFLFYPIITLIIVFLLCMGWMPKLGAMRGAWARTEKTGITYSQDSLKYNVLDVEPREDGNIIDFLVPLAVLIIVAVVSGEILDAVIIGIGVCFLMYIPRKRMSVADFTASAIRGFADMLPVLAMLIAAFTLQKGLAELGLTEYLIRVVTPVMNRAVFPAITFVIVALLTFTTGSNWGMSAVAIPVIMPLSASVGANVILTMAAVISGGAFGSHACFYTDATLLSSQVSGIENMEHALSQFPYVLIASCLSVVAYLICGMIL